jgi:hypothetical protein
MTLSRCRPRVELRSTLQRVVFLSAALALATACGSSANESGTGGAASGDGGASPAGSGGNAGTGGSGAAESGKTVTLTMTEFDVPAYQEVYRCQNFANPFKGDAAIGKFESHMTLGSHHLLLFYKNGATDDPIQDCSGLEFAPTPYSTQLPDDSLAFPTGIAAQIPESDGFRVQSHYLNTTGDTIKAHVTVTFHLDDPAKVTAHAGVLFVVQPQIFIQPHSTSDVTYDCHLPMDMNIVRAGSHMHQHGTNFTSTIAGQKFYETTTWSDPKPELFAPPRLAHQSDPLHFDCTFVNDGATTLTFGESALTNEMCILTANFYPVPDGQVTVGCQ